VKNENLFVDSPGLRSSQVSGFLYHGAWSYLATSTVWSLPRRCPKIERNLSRKMKAIF